MQNLSDGQKRWLTVAGYILFIYATLGLVGAPLRFLRSHGILRLSLLTCFVACFAGFLTLLIRTGAREIWRYALLIGVFATALLIARGVKIPEEQVHFFEYGLVGILFARALEPKVESVKTRLIVALILSALVGALDEGIQGIIPSRHFDVHDIFLNAVSAALGLAIYLSFPSEKRIRSSSIQQNNALRS